MNLSRSIAIVTLCAAAGVVSAQTTVAEYLPAERTQSNGLGGQVILSQTFIPSQSGGLDAVRLIVENRGGATAPLIMEIRPVFADSDTPDMSGAPLAMVSLLASQVPVYLNNDGFFAPAQNVLTTFSFNGAITLAAGQEYAIVLSSPGSSDAFNAYGWYAGPSFSNPAADVNAAESYDGGATFNVYPFNFDTTYQVVIPAPGAAAVLGLAGFASTRRRRA